MDAELHWVFKMGVSVSANTHECTTVVSDTVCSCSLYRPSVRCFKWTWGKIEHTCRSWNVYFFVCMTRDWHKLWLVGNVLLWLMCTISDLWDVHEEMSLYESIYCSYSSVWFVASGSIKLPDLYHYAAQHTASLGKHIFNDNYCPSVFQHNSCTKTLPTVGQFIQSSKCITYLLWVAVGSTTTAEVTLSKVLNPQTLTWGPIQG